MTTTSSIMEKFSGYPVFTNRDVRLFLGRKAKAANVARLLSHMKRAGRIHQVVRGVYSATVDERVSGFAFQPFYYGTLYALTLRELWTQNSRPEIITLKKIRKSGILIFGGKVGVKLHHLTPKRFFGFDILVVGGMQVPVSDPEKTLIDLFFYKIRLPIQDYSGLLKAVDRRKLASYLKAYDGHTRVAVENFVRKYKRAADAGKLESPY